MLDARGEERKGIEVWNTWVSKFVPIDKTMMQVNRLVFLGSQRPRLHITIRDLMLAGF